LQELVLLLCNEFFSFFFFALMFSALDVPFFIVFYDYNSAKRNKVAKIIKSLPNATRLQYKDFS